MSEDTKGEAEAKELTAALVDEAEARAAFTVTLASLVTSTQGLAEKFTALANSYAAFADMGDKMSIQLLARFAEMVANRAQAQAALNTQTGLETLQFMQDVVALLQEWLGSKVQP